MIYTFLADGFEEIEAIAVIDILRRAQLEVQTVSVSDSQKVTGAHGITIIADIVLSQIKEYDMVFLPGGYPGYKNLGENSKLCDILKDANSKNKNICAICASPSILGSEGLLKGMTACCFPSFEHTLEGAEVSYDDVVVCKNIITSRGAGTAHKLAFKIVELYKGKELADELSKTMIY